MQRRVSVVSWDNIMKIVGEFVVAVGGAGAIIVACSSFLSKLWANLFMQREREKHSKEIEKYKQELQKELEEIKEINEEIAYKKRFIFDSEYKYFEELVPRLINAGSAVQNCLALREKYTKDFTNEILENMVKEAYDSASKKNFEFYDYLCKYAVFIDKESYEKMMDFFSVCLKKLENEKMI